MTRVKLFIFKLRHYSVLSYQLSAVSQTGNWQIAIGFSPKSRAKREIPIAAKTLSRRAKPLERIKGIDMPCPTTAQLIWPTKPKSPKIDKNLEH